MIRLVEVFPQGLDDRRSRRGVRLLGQGNVRRRRAEQAAPGQGQGGDDQEQTHGLLVGLERGEQLFALRFGRFQFGAVLARDEEPGDYAKD